MIAIIGEKSKPLNGGIILLNKSKYISVTSFTNENGCLYQSIDGTKLSKHLTKISQKYISKRLFTTNIMLLIILNPPPQAVALP